MNLLKLQDSLIQTLRMPSISRDVITSKLNDGLDYVASQVLLTTLESTGQVDTILGTNRVVIPSDWNYHRDLFSCDTNLENVQIIGSMEHLKRIVPNFDVDLNEGPVTYLTISGNYIVYCGIPSEVTTLTCGYFTNPTHLENDDDIPACIPLGLQKKVLESYVCHDLWENIEDGIEGRKVNTTYYREQLRLAIEELEDTTEVSQSRKLMYRDYNQWI